MTSTQAELDPQIRAFAESSDRLFDAAYDALPPAEQRRLYNAWCAEWSGQKSDVIATSDLRIETSDALVAQQTLVGRRSALEAQVAALRKSADLALARYDAGRSSYFEVLEAQQQLFPAEDELAQTQQSQLQAMVDLYKALGGGWNLTNDQWNRPS